MTTQTSNLSSINSLDSVARFLSYLIEEGHYTDVGVLPDGRWVGIARKIFTYSIQVGTVGDRESVADQWCYHTYGAARTALDAWDGTGEPKGWHRHPYSGRRVAADGTEYVRE